MFGSRKSRWRCQTKAKHGLMVKTQETGNTINKHSIKIPAKSIHIAELVFLKIDLYKMNLLLALRDKIRYFGATFGTFLGNFGHFFCIFSDNFNSTYFLDNYHFIFSMGKFIWTKNLIMKVRTVRL